MIAAVGLYLRLLALDPREAVTLAARLEHEDAAMLLRLCSVESGGCRRVGVHARARPDVPRRGGLSAWMRAVRAGWLRPGDAAAGGCPWHAQGDAAGWGVRGPLGLVAAYNVRRLGPCVGSAALDVPFLAAVAAARHLRALRRTVPADRVLFAWRVGVGVERRTRPLTGDPGT